MTGIDGNFVRFTCFFEHRNFPTINGIDVFDEIECTESGWSLPDDMKPIRCKHVSCPPLLDAGKEVDLECKDRFGACKGEKCQEQECNGALYKCKKEG